MTLHTQFKDCLEPWCKKRGDTAKRHYMFLVGNVHPVNPVYVFLIINLRQ